MDLRANKPKASTKTFVKPDVITYPNFSPVTDGRSMDAKILDGSGCQVFLV